MLLMLTFLPKLWRPYRAKTKGKVERSIGYVRRSFFVPLISRYRQLEQPINFAGLDLEFARWLAGTANTRVHGTTGEIPGELLEQERSVLQPLPPTRLTGPIRPGQVDRPQHARSQ